MPIRPSVGRRASDDARSTAPVPVPPPIAHRGLADALRDRKFASESVDGMDTARDLKAQESEIDQARPPRWIQANAWRPDEPEIAARSLASRQWNLLGVHIGPSEVPIAGAVFNESAVDFSSGDVTVSVQVELSGANIVSARSHCPREDVRRSASPRRHARRRRARRSADGGTAGEAGGGAGTREALEDRRAGCRVDGPAASRGQHARTLRRISRARQEDRWARRDHPQEPHPADGSIVGRRRHRRSPRCGAGSCGGSSNPSPRRRSRRAA